MLIVSDAGPLIALAKVDYLFILQELFDTVLIPPAVYNELCLKDNRPGSKRLTEAVQDGWLRIENIHNPSKLDIILDPGECEAILLAKAKHSLLLIDELRGRKVASANGVDIIGTGRILIAAKEHKLIDSVTVALDKLTSSGYRISATLRHSLIQLANE